MPKPHPRSRPSHRSALGVGVGAGDSNGGGGEGEAARAGRKSFLGPPAAVAPGSHLSSSSTLLPGCSAEATTEEVVELLFFRIPLMGRCEAVEAAIARRSAGRLSVAAWRWVQEGKGWARAQTRQAAAEPAWG